MKNLYPLLCLFFFVCGHHLLAQPFGFQTLGIPSHQEFLQTTDIDGDGRKDMVHAKRTPSGSTQFWWVKNNYPAAPGLSLPIPFPASNTAYSHKGFADMDQDGKADLILIGGSTPEGYVRYFPELIWQKNLGNGWFGEEQILFADTSYTSTGTLMWISDYGKLTITDINLDGVPDFFMPLRDQVPNCILFNYVGKLISQPGNNYIYSRGVVADPLFSTDLDQGISPFRGMNGQIQYVLNSGTTIEDGFYRESPYDSSMLTIPGIHFQLDKTQDLGTQNNQKALIGFGQLTGDFTGEVVACYKLAANSNAYKLGYFTQPFGTAGNFMTLETGNATFTSLHIADLDLDGRNDILAFRNQQLVLYKNMGDGSFSSTVLKEGIGPLSSLTATDMDTDGDVDILAYDPIQESLVYLENGGTLQPMIQGKVYWDQNQNCLEDDLFLLFQKPLILKFEPGNFLAASSRTGRFIRSLPAGTYTTEVINAGEQFLFSQVCESASAPFSVDSGQHATLAIGIKGTPCAQLSISASSDIRVPCRKTSTQFTLFNQGPGPASQVQLRVKIPTVATYRGFFAPDYPLFSQLYDASTGEYVFTTSGLAGGQSRTITVVDSNHCNLSSVGQHHCIQAYVRYGGKCFLNPPNWDRSDLVVRSQCLPDGQAGFHVQNRGMGSMADSSTFRLLSAQGVARTGRLKLNAGESTWLSAAAPGQFLQLQVEQRPHHPIGNVSSAIGLPCGAPPVPGPTLPFATGKESNEESVTLCREVRNSFDPNDKQVWPAGWGEAGNVANGTELHYRIRFENMGNAPAHFVQIRDTLSPHLNPGSLRHLNSSHNEDLRFTVEGTFEAPVLVFTFPSIVLPDSGSDKIKSQGFVSFSISPKSGLAQQTAIRNRAFITFDINTPIETNTTLSTINDSLPVGPPIVVGLAKARHPEALRLQPNPTRDKVDIVFSEAGWGEIRVFDTQGKCLFTQSVRGIGRVAWTAPNSGLYMVRFEKRDGSLEVGRLVVE